MDVNDDHVKDFHVKEKHWAHLSTKPVGSRAHAMFVPMPINANLNHIWLSDAKERKYNLTVKQFSFQMSKKGKKGYILYKRQGRVQDRWWECTSPGFQAGWKTNWSKTTKRTKLHLSFEDVSNSNGAPTWKLWCFTAEGKVEVKMRRKTWALNVLKVIKNITDEGCWHGGWVRKWRDLCPRYGAVSPSLDQASTDVGWVVKWLLLKMLSNWIMLNLDSGGVNLDGTKGNGVLRANLHPRTHQQAWAQGVCWRQQLVNNLFLDHYIIFQRIIIDCTKRPSWPSCWIEAQLSSIRCQTQKLPDRQRSGRESFWSCFSSECHEGGREGQSWSAGEWQWLTISKSPHLNNLQCAKSHLAADRRNRL